MEPTHAFNLGLFAGKDHPVVAYVLTRAYCEINDIDWEEAMDFIKEAKEVFHDSTISLRQL